MARTVIGGDNTCRTTDSSAVMHVWRLGQWGLKEIMAVSIADRRRDAHFSYRRSRRPLGRRVMEGLARNRCASSRCTM